MSNLSKMEVQQSVRCVSAVTSTRAVIALGALKRIPTPQIPLITYYSEHDIWLFQAVIDGRTCELCERHDEHGEYQGNHIRLNFPHQEIEDVDTISANVHPNCRCYLVRLIEEPEPEVELYPEIHIDPELNVENTEKRMKIMLKTVPPPHLSRLRVIQVVDKLYIAKNRVGGAYHRDLDIIQIDAVMLLSDRGYGVVQHEVGHHVHDDLMTPEQEYEWQRLWTHAFNEGGDELPSDYARTSDREGFAEAYTYYNGGLPYHKKFEKSKMYQFIHELTRETGYEINLSGEYEPIKKD